MTAVMYVPREKPAFLPALCIPLPSRRSSPPLSSRRPAVACAAPARELDPLVLAPLGAPKILCAGEAVVDVVGGEALPGGAPCNLAVALARLGTASAALSAVGDDDAGAGLRAVLEEAGVNVDGVVGLAGTETRRVIVDVEDGERSFVGFEGTRFADEVAWDVGGVNGVLFYAAEFLAVGTLGLAKGGSREVLVQLLEVAKACQMRIWVDVNWRDVFWEGSAPGVAGACGIISTFLRKYAEFVKVSVDEVRFLLGEEVADAALRDPRVVLNGIGGGVRGVLVTDGVRGAAWCFDGGMEEVTGRCNAFEAPDGLVVDSVGAGDAFLGGFLAQLFHKGGALKLMDATIVEECVLFGAATAAISVGTAGAIDAMPTREVVENYLKEKRK